MRKVFIAIVLVFIIYQTFNLLLTNYGLKAHKDIAGQHVFISGGGMGLGRSIALLLAKLGCKITIADINMQASYSVVSEILTLNDKTKVQAVQVDVSNHSALQTAINQAIQSFGPIDILINNAGILGGRSFLEKQQKFCDKTIAVNLLSHMYAIRELLPSMLRNKRGHIVAIASMAGFIGVAGLTDYTASKHAVVGFMESLRQELYGTEVKTTVICPYYIKTSLVEGAQFNKYSLIPLLEEEYVAQRTVQAIRQEEEVVLLPWICNVFVALKSFLPTYIDDFLKRATGYNREMIDYAGKSCEN